MDLQTNETMDRLFVFGYGSLTWKPGMEYTRRSIGYINGYKRRFWQGNTTHRGTKERVGRVATLVPDKKSVVWGVAYEICGRDAVNNAFNHLSDREMTLGGYNVITTTFHHRDSRLESHAVIVYMTTPAHVLYFTDNELDTMAMEIHMARGAAGSNSEYVTKLAEFVRDHIPEEDDRHLFELDLKVRNLDANDQNNLVEVSLSGDSDDNEFLIEKRQT